jgi:hypothetical protein
MVRRMKRSTHAQTLAMLMTLIVAAAALFGCGSDDRSSSPQASSTSSTAASQGEITSSIPEGAQLIDPVRWEARLSDVSTADISEVRFLIDGEVEHVERIEPYQFAGDHNLLLPGTLATGSHTFAVDARLVGGGGLTAASTAEVSRRAQPVPAGVVGTWTRRVTPAEVSRTADFRRPEYGDPLPVGRWTMEIGDDGVARYTDPFDRHDSLTVGQVRFKPDGGLVVGNEIPNFPGAEGYFCPDTVGIGAYRWSVNGDNLVIDVIDDRECADRNSFWNGTFNRLEE